jgi:hypothetical protein
VVQHLSSMLEALGSITSTTKEFSLSFFFLFVCVCVCGGTRVSTQDLMLAKQALYHLSETSSLSFSKRCMSLSVQRILICSSHCYSGRIKSNSKNKTQN